MASKVLCKVIVTLNVEWRFLISKWSFAPKFSLTCWGQFFFVFFTVRELIFININIHPLGIMDFRRKVKRQHSLH